VQLLVRLSAAGAAVVLLLYASSFVRLRAEHPALAADAAVVERLASVGRADREARRHVAALAAALERGDAAAATRAADRAARSIDPLAGDPDAFVRLVAAALLGKLAAAVESAPRRPDGGAWIPRSLRQRAAVLDVEALAEWLDWFLTHVYSGQGANGRLTAEGLRLVRALKGGTEMSAAALLLEPVYFAPPGSEAEVRAEAAVLLAHARGAGPALRSRAAARARGAARGAVGREAGGLERRALLPPDASALTTAGGTRAGAQRGAPAAGAGACGVLAYPSARSASVGWILSGCVGTLAASCRTPINAWSRDA